jgi:branched-chain amino acid aminotransferase
MALVLSDAGRRLLGREGRGVLRITWTRGPGTRGFAPPERSRPTVTAHLFPWTSRPPGVVRATVARGVVAGSLAAHKSCSALPYVEAARRAARAGVEEGLLEDGRGGLAEASAANLFLVRGGELVTPPPSLPLLPGLARAWALARARRNRDRGLRAVERTITLEDLLAAEEAFLTSSVRGIVPLVEVDGRSIARRRPGPVSRALARAFASETGTP